MHALKLFILSKVQMVSISSKTFFDFFFRLLISEKQLKAFLKFLLGNLENYIKLEILFFFH